MSDLISKKELLQMTGISYGQLYRWKREKLIPEEWFIKQSSFTGQETFFPKVKILNRIETIQNLKDEYSLDEIAKMISPELTDRIFQVDDIRIIKEIDDEILSNFRVALDKNSFSYIEILLMYALSLLKQKYHISQNITEGLKDILYKFKGTNWNLVIIQIDQSYYVLAHPIQSEIMLDNRFKIIKCFHLDDLSNELKIRYGKSFLGENNITRLI